MNIDQLSFIPNTMENEIRYINSVKLTKYEIFK